LQIKERPMNNSNLLRSGRAALYGAAAVACLAAAGCKPKPSGERAPLLQPARSQAATQVVATPVATRTITQKIDVTGALNTLNDVTVGVKIAGKIAAVYFREGDRVRAGQIVAQQDTADLKAQYDQAYANYLSAQSKLAQAQVALHNAETTVQWTRDQTTSAVKQAQAALAAAREQAAVVKEGARTQERQQAQENVDAAKSDRDRAKADLDRAAAEKRRTAADLKRYQDLAKQDAIAPQQLDQAQAAADSADAAYTSGQAAYSSSDARYRSAVQALSLVQEGSRPEDLRRAQATVDQAQQMLVAARSNRDQVTMRANDVENARANIRAGQAGVEQAKAALDLARQGLSDASIVSPITGIVAERKAEPGMQLGAGKDVMRIVALSTIYFDAQLSENQYAQVHVGQPVDVRVDAVPGVRFAGTVSKIFPVASATARSFTVRITLSNEGGKLRPNLFARGEITLATHRNALVVPREAVLDINGSTGHVFVVAGDVAEDRKVTIGIETIRDIEITSGLQKGDRVVTVGQSSLQTGDRILMPNAAGGSSAP
jgi:HlyD family secretion protein